MMVEPKLCVCGRKPTFHVEEYSRDNFAPAPRGRFQCTSFDHEVKGPWFVGYVGTPQHDPGLVKQSILAWNRFAGWTSFGDPADVHSLTQELQNEAREMTIPDPVVYGIAARLAKRAIGHLRPVISRIPQAYLKEWYVHGDPVLRRRVDLVPECEKWLENYEPVITPLGKIDPDDSEKPVE